MKKLLKTLNLIYDNAMMAALAAVFLIAAYCVYDAYYIYSHTIDKDIRKYKPTESGIVESSPITDEMVGWIAIDGTDISYPVMQCGNNLKYINTDPYGEYSLSGSIFLDCRSNSDFEDGYSIIYGHHMEYGKMFGSIDKFFDGDYIRKHRTGELFVGRNAEKIYGLEIFACMKCDAKNNKIFTPGKSDAVCQEIKDNAFICLDEPDSGRRVVALSTCSSENTDERMVIFCYITDQDNGA